MKELKTFEQICKEELEKIIEGKSTLSTNNKTFYSFCAEIYTIQEVKKHLEIAANIQLPQFFVEATKQSITGIKIDLT